MAPQHKHTNLSLVAGAFLHVNILGAVKQIHMSVQQDRFIVASYCVICTVNTGTLHSNSQPLTAVTSGLMNVFLAVLFIY